MSEEPKTEAKKIVVVAGAKKNEVTIKKLDDKKHFQQSNESY